MRKWIGALCSGLAGVLTLVFLAIPALTSKMSLFGVKETSDVSGWDLLTDGDAVYTAVKWYRALTWILVVLAAILIVMAVLQILSNLGVVKMPSILNTINKFALIGLVVVSVLALISVFGVRAEMIDDFGGKNAMKTAGVSIAVGASLWVISIINLIAGVCANVFARNED